MLATSIPKRTPVSPSEREAVLAPSGDAKQKALPAAVRKLPQQSAQVRLQGPSDQASKTKPTTTKSLLRE